MRPFVRAPIVVSEMAAHLQRFLGASLKSAVDDYLRLDEVAQVLDSVVSKVEKRHDHDILKETRSALRSVRKKLEVANDKIAELEADGHRYLQERQRDKIEAQMLRNRFEIEVGEIIEKLKEGERYKAETMALRASVLKKSKWLQSLQYLSPSAGTPTKQKNALKATTKRNRRQSYGEDMSSLRQARRSLVIEEEDKGESSSGLPGLLGEDNVLARVEKCLAEEDVSRMSAAGKKYFQFFHPGDKRFSNEGKAAPADPPGYFSTVQEGPGKNEVSKGFETPPGAPPPPPPPYEQAMKSTSNFGISSFNPSNLIRNRSRTVNAKPAGSNNSAFASNTIVETLRKESKLSSQDMQRIISLGKKLEMAEQKVRLLQSEREDLSSQLKAKGSVKDFLVGNLKRKELELSKAQDAEKFAKQQSSADREVISFLDGRVRELEAEMRRGKKDSENIKIELGAMKRKMKSQRSMYEDMVNTLRQEAQLAGKLKAEKRVLVKEVKRLMFEMDKSKRAGQNEEKLSSRG